MRSQTEWIASLCAYRLSAAPSVEGSDKQEGNKPKWKKIVYDVKKKDDHGDDKKKDRPFKH